MGEQFYLLPLISGELCGCGGTANTAVSKTAIPSRICGFDSHRPHQQYGSKLQKNKALSLISALTNSKRLQYHSYMMNTTQSVASMMCRECGIGCQRFGKHRNGLRRFRCSQCKKTYTESHERTLGGYLPEAMVTLALQLLLEGNSIRSTERITNLDRNTIMSLLVRAGERCAALMDEKMRNLPCKRLEFDEIWAFIGKKERNVKEGDGYEVGSVWTFCAIDAETKLVPSFVIGQRDRNTTNAFVQDVASRMANRVQVSTDGFAPYPDAIRRAFGQDVDYGRIIKVYGTYSFGERRYSTSGVIAAPKYVQEGRPDKNRISTSYVERLNASTRLFMKRMSRLTLAFSKKYENFGAAMALHFAYYNFCRVHKTLRVTPAMESGLTDHIWTIAELIA
jgi:transposase-like protein/IS1 family transposase